MSSLNSDENTPILVEFAPRPGVEETAILDLFKMPRKKLAQKSAQTVDAAMKAIADMAHRVGTLRKAIPVEFSQVEVAFGIKLDWEVGVLLAKAGTEGSINVKLTWERKDKKDG